MPKIAKKTEHVRSLFYSLSRILYEKTKDIPTMAGKSKNMSQIKQLLLLKKNGVSNRKTAEIIGINKETVNNYMNKVNANSLSIDEFLRLDVPRT